MVGQQEQSIDFELGRKKFKVHLWDAFNDVVFFLDVVSEGKDVFEAEKAFEEDLLIVDFLGEDFDENGEGSLVQEIGDVRGVVKEDVQNLLVNISRFNHSNQTI